MQLLTAQLLNAAFLVSILALVALGLGVIYGLLGVINMAHGELVAVGAYSAVLITSSGLPYWTALVVAPAVGLAAGMFLEATLIRRLTSRPIDAILITLGLSLILQQGLQALFGSSPKHVPNPLPGTIAPFGASYPIFRLAVIVFALIVIGGVFAFFARSQFGLVIKAILQDRDAAVTNGINAHKYNLWAFGIGSALAGLAGCLLAPNVNVVPQMGAVYLAPAFVAVILGGSGKLAGVAAGAAFMGILEVGIGTFTSQTIAKASVLILAIVVIRILPGGLVRGAKERIA
jgi:urea transport system permease protein